MIPVDVAKRLLEVTAQNSALERRNKELTDKLKSGEYTLHTQLHIHPHACTRTHTYTYTYTHTHMHTRAGGGL